MNNPGERPCVWQSPSAAGRVPAAFGCADASRQSRGSRSGSRETDRAGILARTSARHTRLARRAASSSPEPKSAQRRRHKVLCDCPCRPKRGSACAKGAVAAMPAGPDRKSRGGVVFRGSGLNNPAEGGEDRPTMRQRRYVAGIARTLAHGRHENRTVLAMWRANRKSEVSLYFHDFT